MGEVFNGPSPRPVILDHQPLTKTLIWRSKVLLMISYFYSWRWFGIDDDHLDWDDLWPDVYQWPAVISGLTIITGLRSWLNRRLSPICRDLWPKWLTWRWSRVAWGLCPSWWSLPAWSLTNKWLTWRWSRVAWVSCPSWWSLHAVISGLNNWPDDDLVSHEYHVPHDDRFMPWSLA